MTARFFDADGNEITRPPGPVDESQVVCEVGGQFDETSVTLSVYSEQLDREEITQRLGVQPAKAWNPGERHLVGNGRSGTTRIVPWGKWYLCIEGDRRPVVPKIRQLLTQCTADLDAWRELASKYHIQLTIAGHLDSWNRELDLPPDILQLLAERRLMLKIDVYFDGDEIAPLE